MATHARQNNTLNELHWLTAGEIADNYAKRRLSPVELVQALLQRIDHHDTRIHAFIDIHAETALAAARQAEKEISAGYIRGRLHGVPIAVKDNIDIAGLPTTCHSRLLLGHVAMEDAPVISNLRAAGAIILGKLSLHEFAIGGPAFDLPFPPARNPWNTDYHPGGSSSGSGSGLAAGFVPLALGTDTGGSIRNPAGTCGVVGLKPTYGLVSRRGVFPLAFTLDCVGPMARSVDDVATLLDAIGMPDALDPGSNSAQNTGFGSDIARGLRGLRIGFVRHFHETDLIADTEIGEALDVVANLLEREGAAVRDVTLPPLESLTSVHRVINLAESWAIHANWLRERPADYAQISRSRLMGGAFLAAGDYVLAQQHRHRLTAAVDAAFGDVDVLLVANSHSLTCRINDAQEVARTYPRQSRAPFSLTGHPAIAMMCGLSRAGLPMSVQFAGRAHDEKTLLRVAAAYERAASWQLRRPPMDGGSK